MIKVDLSSFITSLNKISNNLPKLFDEIADEIAQQFQQRVIANTHRLFKHNGANGIASSINIIDNGSFSRTVIADKNYAYYVEYGNQQKGEYIYPVNKLALRFYVNGQVVFAKKAKTYPGTHFFGSALQEFKPTINQIIINRLVKG